MSGALYKFLEVSNSNRSHFFKQVSEHCPHMGRVWSNVLTHLFITWMVWKYRLCDIIWHLQISQWMLTLWSFSFPLPFHTKALQVQGRFSCPYALVHALLLACKRQKHEFLSKPTETAAWSGPESTTYLLLSHTFTMTSFIILNFPI